MGELFMGEYGDSQEKATLDVFGVDPDCQKKGVGQQLFNEFLDHLKTLGIKRVNTLVRWDDFQLIHFFGKNEFTPSKIINLERNL